MYCFDKVDAIVIFSFVCVPTLEALCCALSNHSFDLCGTKASITQPHEYKELTPISLNFRVTGFAGTSLANIGVKEPITPH